MRFLAVVWSLFFCFAVNTAVSQQVGFQMISVPNAGNAPVAVDLWYPTEAPSQQNQLGLFSQNVAINGPVKGTNLRLIVISHGNGGSKEEHYDTALALARAGFVVAAPEHTGDNYRDQSHSTDMQNRPRELHLVIDYLLTSWPEHNALNTTQVGAFGFSSGGFTVLATAGGNPDLSLVGPHCKEHPSFYDCRLVAAHSGSAVGTQPMVHDPRIKVIVVAAPALGFTFVHGLTDVTQPVQLWRADDDTVLPAPEYADAVRTALPHPPDFHGVPNADHFDFLAPCSAKLAAVTPILCKERPGFDREAFHQTFNAAVVGFFQENLR